MPAYQFRGASLDLMYCGEREVLLAGPRGTSKSIAAQSKIVALCALWPDSRHLLARKVRVEMNETTLVTFEEEVLGRGHPALMQQSTGKPGTRKARTEYQVGSSVVVVGGFDDPERYKGARFDTVTLEEATDFDESDLQTALGCLRSFKGAYHQIQCVTNPGPPKHWLIERARRGQMRHLVSRLEDNPAWFNADGTPTPRGLEFVSTLDAMTGVTYKRQRLGLWAAAEGQVYDEWDDDLHLRTLEQLGHPGGLPSSWRRIRVVDFGYTHPFVCQWWAFDGDGRAYLYRQLQETGTLVEDHAKEILRLSEGERIERTVCDYEDAEGMATLRKSGIPTMPANKDVESGIQCVKLRLRKAGDGKPRLIVVRGSLVKPDPKLRERNAPTCFEGEIGGYVWDKKRDGEQKEHPLKKDDDAMDAGRYAMKWAETALRTAPMRVTWV